MDYEVITTYSPGNRKAKDWLAKMNGEGHHFHAFACDVADYDSAAACWQAAEAEVGPIDVLINNAGITATSPSAR